MSIKANIFLIKNSLHPDSYIIHNKTCSHKNNNARRIFFYALKREFERVISRYKGVQFRLEHTRGICLR